MRIVLASTSPWRRALLERAGIPAEAVDPGVREEEVRAPDPVALARARALAKARAAAARRPGDLVVGADQVVHLDGRVFGKPADPAEHAERLRALRGRVHRLTTAVALVGPGPGEEEVLEVTTRVRMRADVSDDEIDAYVATGEASGCAGGYMVEGRGAWLVDSLDGDWFNVVGLPVLHLVGRLRARGWRAPGEGPR